LLAVVDVASESLKGVSGGKTERTRIVDDLLSSIHLEWHLVGLNCICALLMAALDDTSNTASDRIHTKVSNDARLNGS
jgi:hypothetical protein